MEIYNKSGVYYFTPDILDKVFSEIQMIQKMNHPAVIRVEKIWGDDNYLFVLREYTEGVSLKDYVRENGPQSVNQVVEWGIQICDALCYFHTLKTPYFYCDMHPGNIILTKDGSLKLEDSSYARRREDIERGRPIFFESHYDAPEQYSSANRVDARTDVYGVGGTLYYLVTGVCPKEWSEKAEPIRKINRRLQKKLEYIISKCMEPQPEKRYRDCVELQKTLKEVLKYFI